MKNTKKKSSAPKKKPATKAATRKKPFANLPRRAPPIDVKPATVELAPATQKRVRAIVREEVRNELDQIGEDLHELGNAVRGVRSDLHTKLGNEVHRRVEAEMTAAAEKERADIADHNFTLALERIRELGDHEWGAELVDGTEGGNGASDEARLDEIEQDFDEAPRTIFTSEN